MRRPCLLIVCILCSLFANSQILLKGKVMDSKTDTGLGGATIFNLSQRIYKKAAFDGQYSIIAMETDTVIFSSAGYLRDTVKISADLLQHGLDLGLKALPVVLDTVRVSSRSYSDDSLERREDYRSFYNSHINNIVGGNTPSNGFGISFSPFSFFSKKERAKRRFRKQLAYNEQQAYIDYYFSASYVHRLTGLSGQILHIFMRTYRPSYNFVRKSNAEDLFRYVNQSLKKFQQQPVNLR